MNLGTTEKIVGGLAAGAAIGWFTRKSNKNDSEKPSTTAPKTTASEKSVSTTRRLLEDPVVQDFIRKNRIPATNESGNRRKKWAGKFYNFIMQQREKLKKTAAKLLPAEVGQIILKLDEELNKIGKDILNPSDVNDYVKDNPQVEYSLEDYFNILLGSTNKEV